MGGRGGPGMGGGEYGMGGGPRHHEMSRHDLEGMDPYMQEAVCCTAVTHTSPSAHARQWKHDIEFTVAVLDLFLHSVLNGDC
jgi:hypothetical protein